MNDFEYLQILEILINKDEAESARLLAQLQAAIPEDDS